MFDPVLASLRDAINSHDPRQVATCFAEGYTNERPLRPHEAFVGTATVLANWTRILGDLPDLHAEILREARNGPELWSEWEMRGTGPDGVAVLLRGPVVLTTDVDGRIDWSRFYLDPVTLAGATSTTVTGTVHAPAERVFALLADPARHGELDASGTVVRALGAEPIAGVGDVFAMAMHNELFGDYTIENHVVVYEPDRALGWAPAAPEQRPLGQRFVWRLRPLGPDSTEVTQTYDWSAITHAPAIPHLPVRTREELAESIRRLDEVLNTATRTSSDP